MGLAFFSLSGFEDIEVHLFIFLHISLQWISLLNSIPHSHSQLLFNENSDLLFSYGSRRCNVEKTDKNF